MIPLAALLTGATVWGLIWYPYRALEHAGVGGALAAAWTYAGALVLGVILLRPRLHLSWMLAAIALTAGWANVGFTIAVIYGDVMRVVLLFYLAPAWTVVFARLLLDEKLSATGYGLMLIALAGAVVMLWQPQAGWPLPRTAAEWIGLSAGAMFALSNVLIRKTAHLAIELKVLAVFVGGIVVASGLPARDAARGRHPRPRQSIRRCCWSILALVHARRKSGGAVWPDAYQRQPRDRDLPV